jgi:hypothetical protein
MTRGKTIIKQSAVKRAAKGLLAAASAAGIHGDIEVDLGTGVVRFHPTGAESSAPAVASDSNEWDTVQ